MEDVDEMGQYTVEQYEQYWIRNKLTCAKYLFMNFDIIMIERICTKLFLAVIFEKASGFGKGNERKLSF